MIVLMAPITQIALIFLVALIALNTQDCIDCINCPDCPDCLVTMWLLCDCYVVAMCCYVVATVLIVLDGLLLLSVMFDLVLFGCLVVALWMLDGC